MKHIAIICIAVLLFCGCATSPVKVSEARQVPPSRLLAGYSTVARPGANTAKVVVVRDSGFLGSAAPAKLTIDGSPVARLWSGERIQFYVSAGDHVFGARPDPQVMGALTENSFSFTPGRTYYFRISISESSFRIQPSAQLE